MLIARHIYSKEDLQTINPTDYMIVSKAKGLFRISNEVLSFDFTFDPSKLEFFPDILHFTKGHTGMEMIWNSEIYNTRDGLSHNQTSKNFDERDIWASFAVGDNGEICLFANKYIALGPNVSESDVTIINSNQKQTDILHDAFPPIKSFIDKGRAKMSMMRRINPLNSQAALEAQVDLLSSLIFSLVDTMTTKPDWYDSFKKIVQSNDSTEVHDIAKTLADIETEKSTIRKLQTEYLATKSKV